MAKKGVPDKFRLARQQIFLDAYSKNFGNVTDAAKCAGVSKQTVYRWIKKYPSFKRQMEEVEPAQSSIEFLESMAYDKIRSGSEKLLIFALKCKGGWNEYGQPPTTVPAINVNISKAD